MTRKGDAGFTLIEVLVSLALFALIAGAGVSVLDQVLRAQTQTDARLNRLAAVQRMMHLVQRDFTEAQPNSVSGDLATITATRGGETGPVAVTYGITDDRLSRQTLVAGDGLKTISLLPDPADLRWQYLDDRGQWHDAWQVQTQANPPVLRAVEMTLVLRDADQALRRLMILPQPMPRSVVP